jgi:hypothetical protein
MKVLKSARFADNVVLNLVFVRSLLPSPDGVCHRKY